MSKHKIGTINFDMLVAIVNKVMEDTFQNDMYNPEIYDLSRRVALITAFVPDYDLGLDDENSDNNTLFEKVYNDEADEVIKDIMQSSQGWAVEDALTSAVNYRLQGISNSGMSMSDYALSKLIDVIADKVSQIDTTVLNDDTIHALKEAADKTNKYDFADKLIDSFAKKGYLSKPNRAVRRKKKEE